MRDFERDESADEGEETIHPVDELTLEVTGLIASNEVDDAIATEAREARVDGTTDLVEVFAKLRAPEPEDRESEAIQATTRRGWSTCPPGSTFSSAIRAGGTPSPNVLVTIATSCSSSRSACRCCRRRHPPDRNE